MERVKGVLCALSRKGHDWKLISVKDRKCGLLFDVGNAFPTIKIDLRSFLVLLLDGLLDFDINDFLKSGVDLAFAVSAKSLVGNVMPEEEDVENAGCSQAESGEEPDETDKDHAEEDGSANGVAVRVNLDVDEELNDWVRAFGPGILTDGDEVGMSDCVDGYAVDNIARTFGEDDAHPGFEGEISEERYVFGTLLAFGEFGKDKESPPSLTVLAHPYALDSNGKRVKVALGDTF